VSGSAKHELDAQNEVVVDAGNWVAVLGIALTAALTVGGWVVSHLLGRLSTADALVDTKQQTIDELKRQILRLEVTAELTDKFLIVLPKAPPGEGGS
jgi:hypothetical protein